MSDMNALVLHEIKNMESLKVSKIPVPVPKTGEVLIKLKAAALNHRDVWIIQGMYAKIKLPVTLGSDGTGIVEQLGAGVDQNWIDKEVMINPALDWGDRSAAQKMEFRILGMPDNGTQADYVVIPVENLTEKPKHLSFDEAAALPLAGLTGYRALFTQGKLKESQTVLLTGIGGGVATIMLQFAHAAGANIFVTSGSEEKIKKAYQYGVLGGANYNNTDWSEQLRGLLEGREIDLIVDSAGGSGFPALIDLARPGGKIVILGATAGNPPKIDLRRIFWKQLTIQGTTMGHSENFMEMVNFVESHQLRPILSGVYSFFDFKKAYQCMIGGKQFGKIVLKIGE